MKGTLALWYEPADPARPELRVELEVHANLWRDLPSRANFLDLGLLFKGVENMTRFYLYVPARLTAEHLEDLSGVLRSGVTANAVFNDVVRFGAERDGGYDLERAADPITVLQIGAGDTEFETLNDPLFGDGTRIAFNEQLCRRLPAGSSRSYVRFRIRLVDDAAATFSSEITARDLAFASSAGRLELTEFRLNERRSFPASFADRADVGRFMITRIHYFLIRDLEHQLVVQHAPFEKVRRLETALWADYVASAYGSAEELTTRLANRLVIYHWKSKPKDDEKEIADFISFASFRTTSTSLLFYAFVIVLLGAAGSVLAALLGELLSNWFSATAATRLFGPWGSWSVATKTWSVLLVGLLAAIAALAYLPAARAGARFRAAVRRSGTRKPNRRSPVESEGDMQ